MTNAAKSKNTWWQVAILIVLSPLLLLAVILVLTCTALASAGLHIMIWTWWCLRGRTILFVYSDSPLWHDYIEADILPYLGRRAVVLNWSRRRQWRMSLATLAFHHFGGSRQFNPLAVVFRPFRRSQTFRFWQPFNDFKHGHTESLRRMESQFLRSIEVHKVKQST